MNPLSQTRPPLTLSSLPENLTRDFVGYGREPFDPRWPGSARLALNIVVNYEEGSEYSIENGDGRSEKALTEVGATRVPPGERDLAAESMYEYGARVGFWRLAALFAERQLPITLFGCPEAFARNRTVVDYVRGTDWDICCHGNRWIEHYLLDEAEERRQIAQAVNSLTDLFGERPLGWYCRYAPSVNTRRLLVEEGGFLYDSDSYADDMPYWVKVGDRPHLVVPYTMVNNDAKILSAPISNSSDFAAMLIDAFDVHYREGATAPKMMSVGLHPRVIGHPTRLAGLIRFLDHVGAHDNVWICRRADIARHFATQFSPAA